MTSFILMGIGLLALIYGIASDVGGQRIWASVLINGFFFFAIALAATFFLAVQYAAEASWAVVVKRVMEAVSAYLPVGAIFLLLVFIGGTAHWHHLYHWMDPAVTDPTSEHYDALIDHKTPYLNQAFFWGRALVFLGVYIFFQRKFRSWSLEEDMNGGLSYYKRNFNWSAVFLVFFGYSSVVLAWDWLMSIDTHWFSTMFGWYIFSGMWISGLVVMTLMVIWLKGKGHLEEVNESHMHDLGKWVFAISFLWSYLWFCQFMLIWYSNIPEEVTYYVARIEDYKVLFFGMFLINFALPMLLLMDKTAKRNRFIVSVIGIIIFIGHWIDMFMIVTPGTQQADGTIGIFEVGFALGFLGIFMFVVLNALSKAPLMVKNHPFLEESKHFHQ